MEIDAEKLANFLVRLGEDPELRRRFKDNPREVTHEHNLSPEEVRVLELKDGAGLEQLFKSRQISDKDLVWVVADWDVAESDEDHG